MTTENKKEILDKLTVGKTSKWEAKAEERAKNEAWIRRSQDIALALLGTLRGKKMSQRELASSLNCSAQHVSKLVSGKENLTLETISRLEQILNIRLISVVSFSTTMEVKMNEQRYYSAEGHLVAQSQAIKISQSLNATAAYHMNDQLEVA